MTKRTPMLDSRSFDITRNVTAADPWGDYNLNLCCDLCGRNIRTRVGWRKHMADRHALTVELPPKPARRANVLTGHQLMYQQGERA